MNLKKSHILISILALVLMVRPAIAGPGDMTKLGLFVRDDFGKVNLEAYMAMETQYLEMLGKLVEKKSTYRSDESFLKFMFFKVHRKFLKQYEKQVVFSEIFGPQGKYDCVTASALYALFLDDLDFEYDVVETDYHVYLLVHAGDKEILFETTDPLNGFSSDQKEILERTEIVLNDARKINEELALAGVTNDFREMKETSQVQVIQNRVGLKELSALHYYNQSLKALSSQDFRKAYKYIVVAQGMYPSKRIKNASSFIFAEAFGN